MIKILIDMNLPPRWVSVLKAEGWDAVHWSSVGSRGAADAEILGGEIGTSYIPPVKPILLVHDYEGLRISPIFGNTAPLCFQVFSSADFLA